jgi:hypothetical protein
MMPQPRRFPPPWSVEEQPACFVVRDHDGQQLAMSITRSGTALTGALRDPKKTGAGPAWANDLIFIVEGGCD